MCGWMGRGCCLGLNVWDVDGWDGFALSSIFGMCGWTGLVDGGTWRVVVVQLPVLSVGPIGCWVDDLPR